MFEIVCDAAGQCADGLELLCLPQLRLEHPPGADVDDGGEDDDPVRGVDRVEADLDRQLGAVLAQTEEVATGPHAPRLRCGLEPAPEA